MQTYGPFYPSTAINDASQGNVPWSDPENAKGVPDGNHASVSISGEDASHFLKASGFSPSIPQGKTVRSVRFVFNGLNPALVAGWNVSDARLVENGAIGSNDSYSSNGHELTWDVDSVPEGVALSMYTSGPNQSALVESVAMYVGAD